MNSAHQPNSSAPESTLLQVPGLWDDGNIFAIGAKVTRAMRRDSRGQEAISAFMEKLTACGSYDEALRLVMGYAEEAEDD